MVAGGLLRVEVVLAGDVAEPVRRASSKGWFDGPI